MDEKEGHECESLATQFPDASRRETGALDALRVPYV